MMNALIIEDEIRNQRMLNQLLDIHCPGVKVMGIVDRVDEAVTQINNLKPEVIFLDIQLKDGSGFDILSRLDSWIPKVIFTTAYDHFAIKAFKYSAVDYLLKPIITDELKAAVLKCQENKNPELGKIQTLLENMRPKQQEYLTISTHKSTEYLKISEIIRFEAQGSYCRIFMQDGASHMISKVLKEFVPKLENVGFFRIHQSHFINLKFVKSHNKGEHLVTMSDGAQVSVSRNNKDAFIREMEKRSLS